MRRGLGFIVLRESVVSDNCYIYCIYTFSNNYFTYLFVSKPVNKGGMVSFTEWKCLIQKCPILK